MIEKSYFEEKTFTTKDTKSTKFGTSIIRKLRALRGEPNHLKLEDN
jgi:hypothetical protein